MTTHDHDHDHGAPGDAHGHAHGHAELGTTPSRKLAIALALTSTFLLVEVVGGWLTGSLALLSDAGHMLTDAGALGLALFAQRLSQRPRTKTNTYGLRRAEILAALVNGLVLGASSVWIVVEAVSRWSTPPNVLGGWVLVVATVGLLVNLVSARVLSGGASNANLRAAMAHVLADAAGSVAAMVAGGLVWRFGWSRADVVVSVLISLLILWGSWGLLRESSRVLLEAAPSGVDLAKVDETIRGTPGVLALHDLHVWTISDGFPVLTVHVTISPGSHGVDVARRAGERIRDHHGIEHVTVQPEAEGAALLPASALTAHKASA